MGDNKDFIIPFAKLSGMTSFASLSSVKKLLETKKIGHTGTLDSFADGLLVLVAGKMTHLASYIEAKDKVYEAIICFGKETDTLDTHGSFVCEKPLPSYSDVLKALKLFVGKIMQVPPSYSALHVEGKRASDIARSGESVFLKSREVCVNEITLERVFFQNENTFVKNEVVDSFCDKKVLFLHVRVACSKGTYIRSLARDIGKASNSCAYLVALRRLAVGCFNVENAFGFDLLPSFGKTIEKTLQPSYINYEKNIDNYKVRFDKKLCNDLDFAFLEIRQDFRKSFLCGKEIKMDWFSDFDEKKDELLKSGVAFVFDFDSLLGVITYNKEGFRYRCVLKENE
ncbi:MAG: tRNA pseudouridine(55) synthase TruB [Treponema sp.]